MARGTTYTFADFVLDGDNASLHQGTTQHRLRPKAFAMLRYLVERPGQLVTKKELLQALWPGIVVADATLTGCIRDLRAVLGDSVKQPRFIETVPTRGYRFIAKVVRREEGAGCWGRGAGEEEIQKSKGETPNAKIEIPSSTPALVGRDAELAQLHGWLDKAQRGERQVVFVTGDPGIGKTTLVNAFLADVAALPQILIGYGQCIENYGAGEAYLPILDALGRLCRGPEGASLIAPLHQHAPTWLTQMPALLSTVELQALQPRVLGTTRERMLRELAEALEVLTVEHTLVLVLEDLHWADASTLDLLAILARRPEPSRLLVLGTYRPTELLSDSHPLSSLVHELLAHKLGAELTPGLLCEDDLIAYLRQRFARSVFPPRLTEVLYHRTDGNPLFLVSMVDDLVAQGVILQADDHWVVQGESEHLATAVPESIRHLVARQRERLQPEEQQMLRAASVAGMEFSVAAVAAALETEVVSVGERCARLAERQQFLRPVGIAEWPDGTVAARYGFTHALYQQLSHERVSIEQQQQWHLRIGECKEAAYGSRASEIASELAVHFEQGRNFQQAVHYFLQSGENALRRSAYQETVLQLTKGLKLLAISADTPRRINQELHILTTLGPALMALKGYGASEVENLYNRARELCQQLGETPQLLPVLGGLWVFYQVRAQLRTARELAEQTLPLARRLERPTALMYPHMWLGQTLFCLGELGLSREHLEQSTHLYDPQRDSPHTTISPQDPRETCLAYISWALWLLGYPDQALEKSAQACALGEEVNHHLSLAHALNFAAWLYQARKEPQAVQHCLETVITLLGEDGSSYRLAQATILRGWAQVEQGEIKGGIVLIQQGLLTWKATGAEALRPCYLALLAEAYHKAGNTGAALDALTSALEHVNKTEERWYEAELYRLMGATLRLQEANQQSTVKNQK